MRLSELEFGSLLSYTPRGDSPEEKYSRDVMACLKKDGFVRKNGSVQGRTILISEWVAHTIQQNRTELPFAAFFQPTTVLVPTPKSSLMKPHTLWVPDRLAAALVGRGLGKEVARCLKRSQSVPKAAFSAAEDRPLPDRHYKSMKVQGRLFEPDEILLVDDVITRGATLLGAANRLIDVFPKAHIRAFAAMRTISSPDDFENVYHPVVGTIKLRELGDTLRRP